MALKRKIAVVMELDWPYKRHYEIFAGIEQYAAEQGDWELHLGNFPQLELSRGTKYDGVVGRISKNCMTAANKAKVPLVNVWNDSPVAMQVPGVQIDFKAAGRMAAEHLVIRGLKRLAQIGFINSTVTARHYEGMQEIANEHDLPCEQLLVRRDFAEKEKYWEEFVSDINDIKKRWQRPIGVGFSNDELAHATQSLFIHSGWRIPEDLAIIGVANEPFCKAATPSISSIDMSDRRCGYEAAQLLDQIMAGVKPPKDNIYIPPRELVLRQSSDSYAVDDHATLTALRFMAQNLGQRISVSDIAAAAGIGRQALERRFRIHLKRTINDELIRLRVSKMKRLLVDNDQTVGEISDLVGFGTTANMHVMFKRLTGVSPITYREKHTVQKSNL